MRRQWTRLRGDPALGADPYRVPDKFTKRAESIIGWWDDPAAMVRELFKVEPDAWQADVLAAFPTTPRIALQACKGPGKTCLLAWLIWYFLLTRPHPKIAATSITGDNLRDCLWAELAKWQQKSELLKGLFTWQSKRIFANDHPDTWWASARTWSRDADPEQHARYASAVPQLGNCQNSRSDCSLGVRRGCETQSGGAD